MLLSGVVFNLFFKFKSKDEKNFILSIIGKFDMEKLKKVLEWIEKYVTNALPVLFLMLMVAIVFMQVFTRFVFSFSTRWAEELGRYLTIWMVFLAGCSALRKGQLVGIKFVVEKVPKKYKVLIELISNSLILFFLFIMTSFGIQLVLFNFTRKQWSPALQIPIGWIYLAIPISGIIMIIFIGYDLLFKIRSVHFKHLIKKD